ncbi:MAG: AAA family ATPase [Armatimonadota bacterium]|nr:AAA family ATPase [Armatimonadota bacterium]MDW8157044.1 AAA family ATPase [Armatimonadota bacterium]
MRLVELRLRNFRQHRQASFQFAPGFNAVVGPNEAGKSALRDALRVALFGNPATTSDRLAEGLRPWGGDGAPVVELVFDVPQGRFELVKDFGAGRVWLRGQGRTWDRPREVQQALGRALGFQSEKAFLATAHVRQAELDRIDERDVAVHLGRIVAGADEDASRALQALHRALQELERGLVRPASNPGRLVRVQQRVQELQDRAEELRRALVAARDVAREAADLRRELEEVEADLADRTELLELNRRIQQVRDQADRLRREVGVRQELLQQVDRLQDQVRRARAELEGLPEGDEERLARVRESEGRAHELEARAQELETLQVLPPAPPPPRWWLWAAAAVSAAAAALLVDATFLRVALAVMAAALALLAWNRWHRFVQEGKARSEAEARAAERARLADQLRTQAQELHRQAQEELRAAGLPSAEALHARAARRREVEGELRSAQQRLQDLLGGKDASAIEEEMRTAAADLHAHLQFLESDLVRTKALLPLEVQRLESEVERLLRRREELRGDLHRLEGQLEAAPDAGELARVEEELESLQEELERLRRRQKALRAAIQVLEEAKAAVEVPARQAVEERAGRFLDRLSGGRYTRVRVPPDADTLRVEVWSEDAGRWLPPEEPHLSRGTVDLVFLAARVALVDVLAAGVRPPLLLDDPFVTFDPQRRRRALDWLRELSQERQVFLFTWDEAVAGLADAVVHLPPPGRTVPP